MIRLLLLFLTTGITLILGVAVAIGLAWIAVAIPVLIATAAGYGLFWLSRRGTSGRSERAHTRL